MNRNIILTFVILQSCAAVDFREYPAVTKAALFGVSETPITKKLYNESKYSFAQVKIGRFKKSILVLASINNDLYLWVGPDGEKIYTVNGKIVKTYGLDHDVKLIKGKNFNFLKKTDSYSSLIKLDSPPALVTINYGIISDAKASYILNANLDSEQAVNGQLTRYVESFSAERYRWIGKNIYWVDLDGRVVKSIQSFHPFEKDFCGPCSSSCCCASN
jgi:DNA-binding beta-propeller fold protein YncE